MSEPTDDEKNQELQIYRYLFSLAGLTEQQAVDLLKSAGTHFPVQPDTESFRVIETIYGHSSPSVWASDRLMAQHQRLAAVFTQIRIALGQRARNN